MNSQLQPWFTENIHFQQTCALSHEIPEKYFPYQLFDVNSLKIFGRLSCRILN